MHSRTRRPLIAACATALLGATLVALGPASVPSAEAAAPTCQGKRATKVGSPGRAVLRGTRGRDVMVTNGSPRVYGGPGDDLICITRRTTATRVFDGPGNDVVEGRGAAGRISVDVSSGTDVVRGTPFPDLVQGGTGADVVYGGAGNDVVNWSNTNGRDRIELGPGNDRLTHRVRPRGVAVDVGAGPGDDVLRLFGAPSSYDIDLRARRMNGPAGRLMGLVGFESYDLGDLGTYVYQYPLPRSRVRFSASDGDDVIDMGHAYSDPTESENYIELGRSVEIYLGDGDDVLRYRGNDSGLARGGPGADAITVNGSSGLRGAGDLATSRFDVTSTDNPDYRARFEVSAWETVLTGQFGEAELAGSGASETLGVGPFPSGPVSVLGRGGDDLLVGGPGNDILTGGDGTDRADGNGGTDTCDAETTSDCETLTP